MILRRAAVLIGILFVLDVQPIEAQCSYSVGPTTVTAASTGQSGSITVITGSINNLLDEKYWDRNTLGEGVNGALGVRVYW